MKTMKCANLHSINDLRYETIPVPKCEEDEVLVAVKSCGICGSDIGRVYTKGTYHFPTVIGHEFAGVVVSDPTGEYTGRKVAVFPLLPCFSCPSCEAGNYATCESYDYYGSRRDGGMSEFIAVKRWNLLPVADHVSYHEAAMCEPVSVSRHAVRKLGIREGDSLLISGAGPIGILAGQWAKSFGAKDVYYIDIDPKKLALAEQFGFLEYREGTQVDCVLEGTGYSDALAKCLKAASPSGRVVLMGNPSGEMVLSQDTYWHILRKELTVLGTWNSSYNDRENDWKESLKAMADGRICVKPLITHTFPLASCNQAFEMMKNRSEFYCKVMLSVGENMEKLRSILCEQGV